MPPCVARQERALEVVICEHCLNRAFACGGCGHRTFLSRCCDLELVTTAPSAGWYGTGASAAARGRGTPRTRTGPRTQRGQERPHPAAETPAGHQGLPPG